MSDTKFTILIDMDDTIEYLTPAWIAWLNERYGTSVTEDDIHDYDMTKAFPTLTMQQVCEPLFSVGLWYTVKPVPGARYAIERLLNDGHEIYIVTSSNLRTIDTKIRQVLFKYFPMIDADHVIVSRKKQIIRGDILIDDYQENLIGGDYLKIMITAAHNRDFDVSGTDINRCDNWDEVYELVTWYKNTMDRFGYADHAANTDDSTRSNLLHYANTFREYTEQDSISQEN